MTLGGVVEAVSSRVEVGDGPVKGWGGSESDFVRRLPRSVS